MTSTTAKTGRNGKFVVASTRVARTTQWQVSPKLATSSEWGDSDGAGFTNRAAGRRDCTFSTEGKYDTAVEVYDLFASGDIVLAVLWMDATSLYWYFGRAMNTEFSLTVNVDSEEVIGWSAGFGADGIFYGPGASGAPSATLP